MLAYQSTKDKISCPFCSSYFGDNSSELKRIQCPNENCKKISFSVKVIAYMDDNILKGEDNKFYYAPGTTSTQPLTEVTTNDSNYQLYTLLTVYYILSYK